MHACRLATRFTFFPDTVANPPSPLRTLAYAGGRTFPGPDADPEGWKVCEPVEITGKLFKARDVSVHYTVSISFMRRTMVLSWGTLSLP
jgi:hypothetical protein